MHSPPLIALENISRRFGSHLALDGVSLDIRRGEVIALLGENGAGKTTLMRIAAGIDAPDDGTIALGGEHHRALTAALARARGIALVHQHFLLVPEMTIAENLALAEGGGVFISNSTLERDAREAASRAGLSLGDVTRRAGSLAVGEMSRVELVKALRREPQLLILDEPTSVLSPIEVEELGVALRKLAAAGTAIVLITHKLPEVFTLAGRVVVLRGGKLVHDSALAAVTSQQLARLMSGEATSPSATSPQRDQSDEPRLRVERLTTRDGRVAAASFEVRRGEVAAIVGVTGNGQRELALALRGLTDFHGEVIVDGVAKTQRELAVLSDAAHVPADRSSDGIFGEMTIEENVAIGRLADAPRFSIRRWQRQLGDTAIRAFGIRARSSKQLVASLSGGNQQKVILARELSRNPRVIVAAEPTRGLDLQAAAFVHTEIRRAARAGTAALLITSDLDEALERADALYVMYRGQLSERIAKPYLRQEIGERMAGVR